MVNTSKKLPCGHIFHTACLRSWFQRQQTCPTCRLNILRTPNAPNDRQGGQAGNNANNNQPNAVNGQAAANNLGNAAHNSSKLTIDIQQLQYLNKLIQFVFRFCRQSICQFIEPTNAKYAGAIWRRPDATSIAVQCIHDAATIWLCSTTTPAAIHVFATTAHACVVPTFD